MYKDKHKSINNASFSTFRCAWNFSFKKKKRKRKRRKRRLVYILHTMPRSAHWSPPPWITASNSQCRLRLEIQRGHEDPQQVRSGIGYAAPDRWPKVTMLITGHTQHWALQFFPDLHSHLYEGTSITGSCFVPSSFLE